MTINISSLERALSEVQHQETSTLNKPTSELIPCARGLQHFLNASPFKSPQHEPLTTSKNTQHGQSACVTLELKANITAGTDSFVKYWRLQKH